MALIAASEGVGLDAGIAIAVALDPSVHYWIASFI